MSSEEASLEDLGIQVNEMNSYMDSLKTGIGNPARQVCICGHPLTRHSKTEVSSYCDVGKLWCACSEPLPALESEDLRTFAFSTSGLGKKHALAKGLHALRKNGKSARWIIERFCFRCGTEGCTVFPVPLTKDERIANGSGHRNALLCESCILAKGGFSVYY